MTQLSFLSADFVPPQVTDLGGILAAQGQITVSGGGCRLSVLVPDRWRAEALSQELTVRGVPVEPVSITAEKEWLVRTDRTVGLLTLAAAWTRGAVKAVPSDLAPDPGLIRCWALTAGRQYDQDIVLGLDPRSPDTHDPLAAVLLRAGLAPQKVGVRTGGTGLRISGRARLSRLADLIGHAPAGARNWGGPDGPAAVTFDKP